VVVVLIRRSSNCNSTIEVIVDYRSNSINSIYYNLLIICIYYLYTIFFKLFIIIFIIY